MYINTVYINLYVYNTPLLRMNLSEFGGDVQTSFLQTKTQATAVNSPKESNEDDARFA
jgi:hypothetical protein